jgi:hypothetical protein
MHVMVRTINTNGGHMKNGLFAFAAVLIVCLMASSADVQAKKISLGKSVEELSILGDMESTSAKAAIPAINKVKAGKIKSKSNREKALRILIRIINDQKKSPEIRIASAETLAALNEKRAVPHLSARVKTEKNIKVKNAFQSALTTLQSAGVKGTPSMSGTPVYNGTPQYYGTPGYYGTPQYNGTPGY